LSPEVEEAVGLRELDLIEKVRQVYVDRTVVPCTSCRYCMPCPEGIDIPKILGMRNDASLYGDVMGERFGYHMILDLGVTAKASECTECRQCADACPQQIDVPEALADCVRLFEEEAPNLVAEVTDVADEAAGPGAPSGPEAL